MMNQESTLDFTGNTGKQYQEVRKKQAERMEAYSDAIRELMKKKEQK